MENNCRQCNTTFSIEQAHFDFYNKVSPVFAGVKGSIPSPTLCPSCRLQRRLAWRNQHFIYVRPSSTTQEKLFSVFTEDVPFPVVNNDEWWSDSWDALSFGRKYDFAQPFFQQLKDLRNVVPHIARNAFHNEQCDYCNNIIDSKNCYLSFNGTRLEDCMYIEGGCDARDCLDCTRVPSCELCYDCVQCSNCYNLQSSQFCVQCRDSCFLSHCRSCDHCFACVNLRNKRYCIYNKQCSKKEYEDYFAGRNLDSYAYRSALAREFLAFALQFPVPHVFNTMTENSTGNYIEKSKNVQDSFFVNGGEDLRFCFNVNNGTKDCCDVSVFGDTSELMYECAMSGLQCMNLRFCYECWMGCSELQYCMYCVGCEHCFACVGLRRKKFCILNMQYGEADYYDMARRIAEQMQHAGQWGEFFPMDLSPMPYNQSLAQLYFPLKQEEISAHGLCWKEKHQSKAAGAVDADELPDHLPESDQSFVIRSASSGNAFRITAQELQRYRRFCVPLPRNTYDERMDRRARRLGGIKLYNRICAKTGKRIISSYPPDSPWIVWDKEVYDMELAS
jgi:hypothetical protein